MKVHNSESIIYLQNDYTIRVKIDQTIKTRRVFSLRVFLDTHITKKIKKEALSCFFFSEKTGNVISSQIYKPIKTRRVFPLRVFLDTHITKKIKKEALSCFFFSEKPATSYPPRSCPIKYFLR